MSDQEIELHKVMKGYAIGSAIAIALCAIEIGWKAALIASITATALPIVIVVLIMVGVAIEWMVRR